jgi:N,N'-diacetyllegionaminate synthase
MFYGKDEHMSSVCIIAEAGVNHNGDSEIAKKLIEAAAKAGADIVKFQTFNSESLASRHAGKAKYQQKSSGAEESQIEMLKKLELSPATYDELIKKCNEENIKFLSTPFDLESIEVLKNFNLDFWKIPSGEITNLPYLVKIAKTGKPVILSSGMSELEEIKSAVDILKKNGAGEITVLHCNTEYPTPFEDVNLNAMVSIKDALNVPVGYSDHTAGIEIPIAAVAMGACVIEKHFTLDKNMEGPDHKASLEPHELAEMVKAIRNIEKAKGNGIKTPSQSEKKNINIVRKSIVAKCEIKKGEPFTEDNITTKRPGSGISPMRWFDVLGKTAPRDFSYDELIEVE